jgi:hypothetical protein
LIFLVFLEVLLTSLLGLCLLANKLAKNSYSSSYSLFYELKEECGASFRIWHLWI